MFFNHLPKSIHSNSQLLTLFGAGLVHAVRLIASRNHPKWFLSERYPSCRKTAPTRDQQPGIAIASLSCSYYCTTKFTKKKQQAVAAASQPPALLFISSFVRSLLPLLSGRDQILWVRCLPSDLLRASVPPPPSRSAACSSHGKWSWCPVKSAKRPASASGCKVMVMKKQTYNFCTAGFPLKREQVGSGVKTH